MLFIFPLISILLQLVQSAPDYCSVTSGIYSDWMSQLNALVAGNSTASNAWPNQPLNNILIQGSHDAGLWEVTSKSPLGVFFSDSAFITQKLDLLEQYCAGTRWFDLRFIKRGDTFVVYHGDLVAGYGKDWATIANLTQSYFSNPRYSKEVVFWRIKVAQDDAAQLISLIRQSFEALLLKKPSSNAYLPVITLNDIWSSHPSGTIVLLNYEDAWMPPAGSEDIVWSYDSTHGGRYSDTTYMEGMLAKCTVGQQVRITQYITDNLNVTFGVNQTRIIMTTWWTFTGGDIQQNTKDNWGRYISPFKDFYVRNNGTIGNVIVSDFVGSYDFMSYVMMYNKNLFATFPPKSPIEGLIIDQPFLPGWDLTIQINNGTCSTGDNASDAATRRVIFFLVGVILCGLILICCCFAFCYLALKEKRNDDAEFQRF